MRTLTMISFIILTILLTYPCGAGYITVNTSVDLKDVSTLNCSFIIKNDYRKNILITGIGFKISDRNGYGFEMESNMSTSKRIDLNESVTFRYNIPLTKGDPLEKFIRKGYMDLLVRGEVRAVIDNESVVIPFKASKTVHLKMNEIMRAVRPSIEDIDVKVSRYNNQRIFVYINVSVKNPNPVAMENDYGYRLWLYRDGGWVLCYGSGGFNTIEPNETCVISHRYELSNRNLLPYLMNKSRVKIKIAGSMFMYFKEGSFYPIYFELPFEKVFVVNVSDITGEKKTDVTHTMHTPVSQKARVYYKLYRDNKTGFKIAYPGDWDIIFPEVSNISYYNFTFGEIESCVMFKDRRTPACVLVIVSAGRCSLDEIREVLLKNLKKFAIVVDCRDTVIDDKRGFEVIYKRPFGVPVKQKLVVLVSDGRYYMIQCSVSEELYDEYENTFDEIVSSFSLSNKTPGFELISVILGVSVGYILRKRSI